MCMTAASKIAAPEANAVAIYCDVTAVPLDSTARAINAPAIALIAFEGAA
jgi:hypothetical protein